MSTRPGTDTGPSLPAFALRAAAAADVPFLLELRLATMGPHFERQGRRPSLADHRQRVLQRLDAAEIVECAGRAAGLRKLLREGDAWTLEQIQLVPAVQRRGIGSALVADAIAQARAAGASLQLHVLKDNPARRLYERLGFVQCAESAYGCPLRRT